MFKILVTALWFCGFATQAQQPQLKGGLSNFLKTNIIYPGYSKHHCIQGTVKVGFKVDLQGNVRQVVLSDGIGADLDEEALRLVKLTSGKWMVPVQHDTASAIIVPVNFVLEGYGCERASKADIALALRSYADQEALLDVVTNFYKAKERGKFNPADEAGVMRIKNELHIDEEYFENIINLGLKKIKQGDREGGCKEFNFVKYLGSNAADEYLSQYCK